jgi:cobalt/nickel transport system permease protein
LKHDFFDSHNHEGSILSGLDPRAKLLATLAFIILITLLPNGSYHAYLALFFALLVMIVASKVRFGHYLQSLLLIAPLLLAFLLSVPFIRDANPASTALSSHRLELLFALVSKTVLSYLFSVVLLFSTSFTRLMEATQKLGMPKILVMIANFAYRYQFIIVDEVERLSRSRNSRLWQPRFINQAKTIGYMAGTLFIRSYERSERVYMAMSSRGFDGKFVSESEMKLTVSDFAYLLSCAAIIAAVWIWLA